MDTTQIAQRCAILRNDPSHKMTNVDWNALCEQACCSRQTEKYCEFCSNATAWG